MHGAERCGPPAHTEGEGVGSPARTEGQRTVPTPTVCSMGVVDVPGVDSPGSGLTRPPAGPGSARGQDSLGLPRVAPVHDIHYGSRGVPDPPPYWGFRDRYTSMRCDASPFRASSQ